MPNSRVTALRPPVVLLALAKATSRSEKRHTSEVIRMALDDYVPPPYCAGAPCPVRHLYARLGGKLSPSPVAFSAPFERMAGYQEKQYRAGLSSLNGLVALALAFKYAALFKPYHEAVSYTHLTLPTKRIV